jgi:hypothetical protein
MQQSEKRTPKITHLRLHLELKGTFGTSSLIEDQCTFNSAYSRKHISKASFLIRPECTVRDRKIKIPAYQRSAGLNDHFLSRPKKVLSSLSQMGDPHGRFYAQQFSFYCGVVSFGRR